MGEPERRTPPDAPIVSNDEWRNRVPVAAPFYCGRLGFLTHRRHVLAPEPPVTHASRCARCGVIVHDDPFRRTWRPS